MREITSGERGSQSAGGCCERTGERRKRGRVYADIRVSPVTAILRKTFDLFAHAERAGRTRLIRTRMHGTPVFHALSSLVYSTVFRGTENFRGCRSLLRASTRKKSSGRVCTHSRNTRFALRYRLSDVSLRLSPFFHLQLHTKQSDEREGRCRAKKEIPRTVPLVANSFREIDTLKRLDSKGS